MPAALRLQLAKKKKNIESARIQDSPPLLVAPAAFSTPPEPTPDPATPGNPSPIMNTYKNPAKGSGLPFIYLVVGLIVALFSYIFRGHINSILNDLQETVSKVLHPPPTGYSQLAKAGLSQENCSLAVPFLLDALNTTEANTEKPGIEPPLFSVYLSVGVCTENPFNAKETLANYLEPALRLQLLGSHGKETHATASILESMARLRARNETYDSQMAALGLLERAFEARKGDSSNDLSVQEREKKMASLESFLVKQLQIVGMFNKSISFAQSAISYFTKAEGRGSTIVAELSDRLASALASVGRLAEAESLLREVYVAHDASTDRNPSLLVNMKGTMCATLIRLGKPEDAVLACRSALEPAEVLEGKGSILVGKLHAYLAAAFVLLEDGVSALQHGVIGLPILRARQGDKSRGVANLRLSIGDAINMLGGADHEELSLDDLHAAVQGSLDANKPGTKGGEASLGGQKKPAGGTPPSSKPKPKKKTGATASK